MLKETIRQAIEKGLIKSTSIIVDSTHTNAAARPKTVTQVLRDLSKELRKEIYREMYDLSEKFPDKPNQSASLTEEIDYTKNLLESIGDEVIESKNARLIETYTRIKELLDSDKIREIRSKVDEDARFGHKSPTSTFYGYKNHLAMTEERLITGIKVTSGESSDGKHTIDLIEQSKSNGIEVKEVIGDSAYCSRTNLDYCKENDITLIAKTNIIVANSYEMKDDGFEYNKDAKTMQCPAAELALSIKEKALENGNTSVDAHFSKHKCKKCPLVEKCKVGISKSKNYHFTLACKEVQERMNFEKSDYFRQKENTRYKIEQKNGELKQPHGLARADAMGLVSMQLQTYFTAFVVNIKRIVKLTVSLPS
ncbi:MAG: transposase [Lachnospirales bacterium]